VFLAKQKQKW